MRLENRTVMRWILVGAVGLLAFRLYAETPSERDDRFRWWREARFGVLVQWGAYSMTDVTVDGKKIASASDVLLKRDQIPVADFKKITGAFQGKAFKADDWVKAVRSAGGKYLVFTAKQSDGLAMFDSKATDWCVTRATPFARDPVKDLSNACQKQGLKFGVLFNQSQDWYHPGGTEGKDRWDKAQDGNRDDFFKKVAVPQVKELLSNYGPISLWWWDKPVDVNKARAEWFLDAMKLQPMILQNNRLGAENRGDFESLQSVIPRIPTAVSGWDWESYFSLSDKTWTYRSGSLTWKSPELVLAMLIDVVSQDGNFTISVPATGDGALSEPAIKTLNEVGNWLNQFGEAIYATRGNLFAGMLDMVRCTYRVDRDSTTLYLLLPTWPADGMVPLPGLKNKIESARLLGVDPKKRPVFVEQSGSNQWIHLTGTPINRIASVVAARIKGRPDIDRHRGAQDAAGRIVLTAADATLHGDLKCYTNRTPPNIGSWHKPTEWLEWTVTVSQPGTFAGFADLASPNGGAKLRLEVGDQKVEFDVPKTGDWRNFQPSSVAPIRIPAGKVTIAVKPVDSGWTATDLRWVVLRPKEK